jgi:hypothetical protein
MNTLLAIAMTLAAIFTPDGAPIPPRPGGYYPPPAAVNDCLETYRKNKSFRCDRVFGGAKGGFQ